MIRAPLTNLYNIFFMLSRKKNGCYCSWGNDDGLVRVHRYESYFSNQELGAAFGDFS